MPLDSPAPDEVLALHYDEAAVADEIAAWCGGEVGADGGGGPVVHVPTAQGSRVLLLGMWVKRLPDGTHDVDTAEDFAARHEPASRARRSAHGRVGRGVDGAAAGGA